MKKTITTILCTAIFAVLAVSCQESIDSENLVEPTNSTERDNGTIDICVNGLMGEYTQVDGTKAELVNTVRVSWKGGETVYVYDGTQCLGTLKASLEGTEDRYALLSTDTDHTVKAPATGTTKLTLVYSPLLTEAPAVNDGAISISLASQSGAKAPFVAYATLDYTGTNITDAVVPFQFATSVIKVNCTGLKPGTAITSATLSNVNTACRLTLSGSDAPRVSGDVNGTITRTGDSYFAADKINAEGEAVFQIAVPALEEASQARVMTVAQGSDKVEDKKFTKKALSAATSVNTVCQLVNVLPAGALPGVFTVDDNGTPEDTSDDVKVHFSKGNLTCDISGATPDWKFYEHQYDCATGYDPNLISLFTWGYGTWSTSPNGTDYQTGDFTDWGKAFDDKGTWRTLSTAEWQYLFNTRTMEKSGARSENLTSSGITVEDVLFKGVVLFPDNFTNQADWKTKYTTWKALNDAGIVFLPAAGIRDGSGVYGVGDGGVCWSSTANDESSAYDVFFNSLNVYPVQSGSRNYGLSVRLITEVK